MPKITNSLSAIEVKRLTVPKMHAVGTVAGLMLNVKPTGSKSWILRTTVGTRRSDVGLGSYPEISLAAATEAARVMKNKIKDGVDPVSERRAKQAVVQWTFKQCALAYIKGHRESWKNAKHGQQWENTLLTYVYPVFGNKHVRDVTMTDVINAIEPQWTTKNETMVRVRNRIELVLAWAAARGYRSKENPAQWRGNLDHVLPRPSKVNNRTHYPAVPISDVHAFAKKLHSTTGTAARCLEFVILTACRSGEARLATWAEFDLKAAVWSIPGERMKSGRPHRVPLSAQVVKLLQELPRFEGTELLFPGRDGEKPLSDMSLTAIMRRMQLEAVPHGFRSTFSDWTAERTYYPAEVREMALAHAIGDGTEAAYRRGDLFDKRRHLMSDWAAFIDSPPATGDNVIQLKTA
jgi:integrase